MGSNQARVGAVLAQSLTIVEKRGELSSENRTTNWRTIRCYVRLRSDSELPMTYPSPRDS